MTRRLHTRRISPQLSLSAARGSDSVFSLILYITTVVSWYFITSPTTIQIIVAIVVVLAIAILPIKDLFTMSSPKAPRTPVKPTDKANGHPKSPDSIKKVASTHQDGDNVVKKRVPSQNVKTNTTSLNKDTPPQTSRPKQPKSSEDQLAPQTPTPDRSSKRQPATDAPPPKFKAATSSQGDAAKPVMKKVKKASPPADSGNEKQGHLDSLQNGPKEVKKQAPPLQQEPEQEKIQKHAEKPKPKFKAPELDVGQAPKSVVKKKKPVSPPPELEQELEHEDAAASNHDEVEHEDDEDDVNENGYHGGSSHDEELDQGGGEEEESHKDGEAGSDWDGEHETYGDDDNDNYEGYGEGEQDDGTDGEQDTQSQQADGSSEPLGSTNDEARNSNPVTTDEAVKPTKDIQHKARKNTPATIDTTATKEPELLDDLVEDPDAVFGDDMDALGVSQAGVPDGVADTPKPNSGRGAQNNTVLQSGGNGGIGITANGIEINVQTTKEGTSVTIKIPGVSQQ
ncbi:hypothetical protein V495_06123 [Pseudogymnoascus sp. VKM F-4514 (FW-929)]|nr:hypothetical protein V495_06123 [Pseudogymnoascus sp. VKM F-4514 (FW-929)]KFY56021.1 hypothetical protein V497_06573 [Pseudogymnoascus sp. VKM F-4516 (FW-969)]